MHTIYAFINLNCDMLKRRKWTEKGWEWPIYLNEVTESILDLPDSISSAVWFWYVLGKSWAAATRIKSSSLIIVLGRTAATAAWSVTVDDLAPLLSNSTSTRMASLQFGGFNETMASQNKLNVSDQQLTRAAATFCSPTTMSKNSDGLESLFRSYYPPKRRSLDKVYFCYEKQNKEKERKR